MSSREYLRLVDELIAGQDEIREELMAAMAENMPERYRDMMMADIGPHIEVLLPIGFRCLRDRTDLTASDLAPIIETSRAASQLGIPLSLTVLAIGVAIGRFGAIVVRQAGARHPVAVATVISHAAVLSHQFSQAATTGRQTAPVERPAWADEIPILDLQVLRLAADGLSTKQIAQRLHYSDQAVSYHLSQLMKRMEVTNRTALVARALHYQLVSLPPAL